MSPVSTQVRESSHLPYCKYNIFQMWHYFGTTFTTLPSDTIVLPPVARLLTLFKLKWIQTWGQNGSINQGGAVLDHFQAKAAPSLKVVPKQCHRWSLSGLLLHRQLIRRKMCSSILLHLVAFPRPRPRPPCVALISPFHATFPSEVASHSTAVFPLQRSWAPLIFSTN